MEVNVRGDPEGGYEGRYRKFGTDSPVSVSHVYLTSPKMKTKGFPRLSLSLPADIASEFEDFGFFSDALSFRDREPDERMIHGRTLFPGAAHSSTRSPVAQSGAAAAAPVVRHIPITVVRSEPSTPAPSTPTSPPATTTANQKIRSEITIPISPGPRMVEGREDSGLFPEPPREVVRPVSPGVDRISREAAAATVADAVAKAAAAREGEVVTPTSPAPPPAETAAILENRRPVSPVPASAKK